MKLLQVGPFIGAASGAVATVAFLAQGNGHAALWAALATFWAFATFMLEGQR
jgi:hypothetical protein